MTLSEFKASIQSNQEPNKKELILLALWKDGKGDWSGAHSIVQEIDHPDGAWVHAYLHRKEGDEFNAKFWYNLADKKFPNNGIEDEWEQIVSYFLNRQ